MAESRAGRFDIRREFRPIERFFGGRSVLLRDDVVDRLFHCYYFLFTLENTTDQPHNFSTPLSIVDPLTLLFFLLFLAMEE